ncbi:hypothetical protein SAMD00019534_076380 [Acytostelium subglobosum LB1]|uniref:hypothetical protein n=1 Tax=Acytostelium subglobosum LB1 TaxID=1410327 RepID=UPI000644F824|nr:hypothetical protein SAMD00019534_076380 [Acytostelium subglobosum LB1]GAM24463.1 hypothetical protein SAMD00019534_076380 [Acytostelium subglobosum LB1]|eukprot:XP_012752789.1 hypothetical protein SAMD00019534_076380 [Acytostelium subglobosum LB1]
MNLSPRDLLDHLIIDSKGQDKDSVVMVGNDFIVAGSETSASTLELLLMFMINYPEIQEKMAGELESVVGLGNRATVAHRSKCPYTNAVIKEVMRIMPVLPLGLPRQAKESIIIADKYYIPKGAMVMINQRALHHNSDHWTNPDEFRPERFLVEDVNHNDYLQSFSCGPRNCVGQILALDEMFVGCANIVNRFKVNSIDGQPVNDEELFGLVITPNQFQVCLKARS